MVKHVWSHTLTALVMLSWSLGVVHMSSSESSGSEDEGDLDDFRYESERDVVSPMGSPIGSPIMSRRSSLVESLAPDVVEDEPVVVVVAPSVQAQAPAAKPQEVVVAAPQIRPPYVLELLPFVSIGIKAVRPGPRHDPPPGYRVACPGDKAYCIDYKASDNGTCMYPDPLEIKACYDASCVNSAWGPTVRRQQGEDTYCKDFMTPNGRLCQWLDTVPCTCESRSVHYYSGEFVAPGQPIPAGFREAHPCTYPLDVIRRAAEEAALRAKREKAQKLRPMQRRRRAGPKQADTAANDGTGDIVAGDAESSFDDDGDRRRGRRQRQELDAASGTLSGYGTISAIAVMAVVVLHQL